jgi:hypothetical protein
MPIRKRISDPFGDSEREIALQKRFGPPPTTPRKPSLEERQPLLGAIGKLPLGQNITTQEYNNKFLLPWMRKEFTLWGATLALYPIGKRSSDNKTTLVVGVQICQKEKHRRTGQLPVLKLTVDKYPNTSGWYGRIIRWLEETKYSL